MGIMSRMSTVVSALSRNRHFGLFERGEQSYIKSAFEHLAQSRFDSAEESFNRAIELSSTAHPYYEANLYEARGLASMSQSRYDEAIVDFNSAIKLDPDYANPYGHRGRAWSELSEYDKAIGDFSRAIALNELAETYMARGDAYSKKEEHSKAIKDYEKALNLHPSADAFAYRGSAYLHLGEHDKALSDFYTAMNLDPVHPTAHLQAATAYFKRKDFKKTIRALTKELDVLPDFMEANAALLRRLEQEEQLQMYDEILNGMAQLHGLRGICHIYLGNYREAIEDFDAAINLNPYDVNYYRGRGCSHMQIGEGDLAVEDLTTAIKLDSDSTTTYVTRGIVYMNNDDYDSARKDFDLAIHNEPDQPESYTGRGICHLFLGEYNRALSDLDMAAKLEADEVVGQETDDSVVMSINPSYTCAIRGLTYEMLGCEVEAKSNFDRAQALGYDRSLLEVLRRDLRT